MTAWELMDAGIDVTLIADSAAASLLAGGTVEAVLVGADRIAANGDTASKIGTFSLAIAPEEVKVWNPAFDLTPHDLITGFITDAGVVQPPFSSRPGEVSKGVGEEVAQ